MAQTNGAGPGRRVTPAQLDTFFTRYGWDYDHPPETEGIWQTGFTEDQAAFDIFVQLTEEWVIFMIYPFTLRPEGTARARVAEHLATLNYALTLVKAGIDDEGDTFLGVELPTEDFTYNHFRIALDQLSEAALTHHMAVELLATGG